MAVFLLCGPTKGVLTFKGKQRLGLKELNFWKHLHITPAFLAEV